MSRRLNTVLVVWCGAVVLLPGLSRAQVQVTPVPPPAIASGETRTVAPVLAAPGLPALPVPGQPPPGQPPGTSQPPAKPPRGEQPKPDRKPSQPQAFSVVLVLGDLQAAGAEDDVPAAARKALADIKDFLPFKSYKLLDAAWMLCCNGSRVVNRLRGVDGREYALEITSSPAEQSRTNVRFSLRDAGELEEAMAAVVASSRTDVAESLRADAARLEAELKLLREKGGSESDARRLERRIEQTRERIERGRLGPGSFAYRDARALIDTSFTMDIGETVVVGTSRLSGGSKALIALLTAVPPRSMR